MDPYEATLSIVVSMFVTPVLITCGALLLVSLFRTGAQ